MPDASRSSASAPTDHKLRGVARSLVIGVGGTGHKVLLDIRERLIRKHGSLDKLPIVSFLLLDTDQAIFSKVPGVADAANLDNADKIHISVHGVEALRRTLPEYPNLRDWLDPRTLSGDIHQGAGAVRARGRLAFFWNYATIARRIEEAAAQITKDSSKAVAIRNGLQVSEGVTVYIVGSLLGGTGSGIFLDLAYTVKDLLRNQRMLEVVGIFSIPPNSAAVAVDNRPNAYASLLELNHYSDVSTTFTAQYQADQPGIENADPPFRYTYLVDTSSPKANLGSVDRLVEMVGHSLFLDLTSEFQRQKRSNRDNFDQFLTQPDELGCPQNYLAMGLSAIHFPREKVVEACACRLARRIVSRWTEPLERISNIGAFTDSEAVRLGLDADSLVRQVSVAGTETGELVRDVAMAWWSRADRQYQTRYPGHRQVVEFLTARLKEHEARFADTDPNPDFLSKQRAQLGEYLFQMQQNLRALHGAKETALRGFLGECVNDPARRHGVARAFLDQLSMRLRSDATELGRRRDRAKEELAPAAAARDSQLGEIQRLADDAVLSLIPTAKRREIDERKDAWLSHARRWEAMLLEIRSAELALAFIERFLGTIEALKDEMDAYIDRMRSLEVQLRKAEQEAVESPVDVNGLVLFDRGRRIEREDGTASYVQGDIDQRYAVYVGDDALPSNPVVGAASSRILAELGSSGDIYSLRGEELVRIRSIVETVCREVFDGVGAESVLDKFFERFGVGTERCVEEMRRIHALSQPFIHLQENAPAYRHHQNKEQTIVGVVHGAEPRSESEMAFHRMLKETVEGIRDGQITDSNEPHQVLFLRERAAFPLRLLEGLDNYRFAYDQVRAQGSSANPVHTRRDVRDWVRIAPPSAQEQMAAWRTFCVAWALGVVVEESDVRYTAVGTRETVSFVAHYKDRFGLAKSDPLGSFGSVTGDLARLIEGVRSDDEVSDRAPREARGMVLLLCDQRDVKDHLDRAIEEALLEGGIAGVGERLLAHASAQAERFPRSIVRPYQSAITHYLEVIRYQPGVSASAGASTVPGPQAGDAGAAGNVSSDLVSAGSTPVTDAGLDSVRDRLARLRALHDDGLIDADDFARRKAEILAEI